MIQITRELLIEKEACKEGLKWWIENIEDEGLSTTQQIRKIAYEGNKFCWANYAITALGLLTLESLDRYAGNASEVATKYEKIRYYMNSSVRAQAYAIKANETLDYEERALDAFWSAKSAVDFADNDIDANKIANNIIEYGIKLMEKQG